MISVRTVNNTVGCVLRLLRHKQNTRSVSLNVFIEVVTESVVCSKRDKQEMCFACQCCKENAKWQDVLTHTLIQCLIVT